MKAARAGILLFTAMAMAMAMVLAGCGGGGGGSGAAPVVTGLSAAPESGPGDTAALVPLTVGNNWIYDEADSATGAADVTGTATLTVTGTQNVGGVNATVLALASSIAGNSSYNEFFTSSGGGITSYGNDDPSDPITNQLAPYVNLPFPVTTGAVSHVTGTHISAGKDDAGNPLTANVDQQVSVAGTETVTVAAGVFADAVKVVTTTSAAVTNAATNQTVQAEGTDTTWFAPGVGPVKETATFTGNGTTQTSSYEARGYTVNGVVHGLGTSRTMAEPAGAGGSAPGQSASGGGTFMTLAFSNGAETAFLTNTAGDLLASIPLEGSQLMLVAFSGSNYLIASLKYDNVNENSYVAVQRISTAGVLLDPNPGIVVWSSAPGTVPSATLLSFNGAHRRRC